MSGRDMAEEGKELLLDDEGCTDSEAESQTDLLQVSAPSGPARFKGLFVSRRVVAPSTAGAAEEYRLYPWRWFMLACICLINVSNGAMWLTFAPIPQYTAVFYSISVDQVDWFSISYFIVSLLTGFVAIAILDIFGLKVSLYLGAIFNVTGSVLRWLSSASFMVCSSSGAAFALAMTGQVLTACAQPFLLYSPTKLANLWFGDKERAFCTMLASLGNPIGLATAQLISPYVVTSLSNFSILHLIYTVPAAVGAVLIFVAFWWKQPPLAPAPSACKTNVPFLTGLKRTLTTPAFLWLMVVWGCGSGIFNALLTLLAQILCPYGYSDRQSGLWGALMVFIGLVGATVAGVLIDFSKLYKEVAVVSFSLSLLCLIWFIQVFHRSGHAVLVAFSISLFGFFGLPLIPACMEAGVEITYPVSEATSSGLLWSTTQVVGIVLVLSGQQLQTGVLDHPLTATCELQPVSRNGSDKDTFLCLRNSSSLDIEGVEPKNFTNALLLYAGVGVAGYLVLVILFRPKYKRLEVERRAKGILNQLKGPGKAPPSVPSTSATSSTHHSPPGSDASSPPPPSFMLKIKPTYHTSTEL